MLATRVFRWSALPLAVALVAGGCDFAQIAAQSSTKLFDRASVGGEAHWDYELLGDALPMAIVQNEGVLSMEPWDPDMLQQTIQTNYSYAYGWLEDRMQRAELEGDFERASHLRKRARLLYLRSRELSKFWMRRHADGLDKALQKDVGGFEKWLEASFQDEWYAPMLFWFGASWGSFINISRDDMTAVADLPYAQALVKHSVKLDPTYFHAGGLNFLGTSEAESMSGDLQKAKGYFERALRITDRRALLIQYNYARSYAIQEQDRELFVSLLEEVLNAGDIGPTMRMQNQIAKRRARRKLDNVDKYFAAAP